MEIPNTLKVTIIGRDGRPEHFLYYDVHPFDKQHHRQLLGKILRRTESISFDNLQLFWVDDERDWINIIDYRDVKNYVAACAKFDRKCQIFVRRRESRFQSFLSSVKKAIVAYGKIHVKWRR